MPDATPDSTPAIPLTASPTAGSEPATAAITHVSGKRPLLPPELQDLFGNLWWNIRLFFRWLRPKAVILLVLLLAAILRPLVLLARWLIALPRNPGPRLQNLGEALLKGIHTLLGQLATGSGWLRGWLLWQCRALRQNPDRRLAAIGLLGGFIVPLLTVLILARVVSPADPMAPYIDPSVPVPASDFIEASPDEDRNSDTASVTSGPVALTPDNFTFELFAQRRENGELHLLSHAAERYVREWYPNGTPAVNFMRFFGKVMLRAGGGNDLAIASRQRCLSMPNSRSFTQRTVTCTYGHVLPEPLQPDESPRNRAFWIVALSFDSAGKLTDLRIHARLTRATP